ncbi:MAG: antibiotic biosynthesis monooxygenase [Chloroflexi bacterium]|nr:antibiotic biosynthesis monooxygenase [Chloroflexota bacterium]
MAVIRLTTFRPAPEDRARVARLLDELNEFLSRQPGFILALRFASPDGGEMGRIGIWESEERADAVAQMQHNLALRSQLMEALGEEVREESLYQVASSPTPLPPPRR